LLLIGDRSGWTLWGAAAVLTAAGLSHWDFLVVTDCVLVGGVLLSLRTSRMELHRGTPLFRTDSARFAVAGLVASALTFGLVFWLLRASLVTVELAQFPGAWLHKFLTRFTLLAPAVAGLFVVAIVDACFPDLRTDRAFDPSAPRRVIKAWGYIMAAGVLLGLVTLKLPPSRFLDLLLAFPASVAVGAAVALLGEGVAGRAGTRGRSRAPRTAAIVAVGAGILLLAVPGMIRWYPYATWLQTDAVSQAGAADRYMDTLGPRSPVVFVLRYRPEFAQGVAAEERNILFGLSPENEERAYFFVGDPADALAGRRTDPPDENSGDMTQPYWKAVRSVLPSKPPVVILRGLAPGQFQNAGALGGQEIAPGVMLLQGPPPLSPVALKSVPDAAPPLPAALGWALLTFALLAVAGIGWSYSFLRGRSHFEEMLGLAPALGAAAIVLGAFLVDELGMPPGRLGGLVGFVFAAASGVLAALWRMRRTGGGPGRLLEDGATFG